MNIADQDILITVLRITAGLIILFISSFIYIYMRRTRYITIPKVEKYTPPKHIDLPEEMVMLSVLAKPGRFVDTKLLFESLYKLGFQFSRNHIFEYILDDGETIAFSVANYNKPHAFNKDYSKVRPTSGVLAILSLPVLDGTNQSKYFHLFLSVLEELKDMLGLEICTRSKKPINDQIIYDLKKQVNKFEDNYTKVIQDEFDNQHLQTSN